MIHILSECVNSFTISYHRREETWAKVACRVDRGTCQNSEMNPVSKKCPTLSLPVPIPRAAPMPRTTINRSNGGRPRGGAMFFLSVAVKMATKNTAVAMNSEKKQETFVI